MTLIDLLRQYWERIGKKVSSPEFMPHPIIKALMLATKSAQDGGKDGNYTGLSGDADLEPDKKPHVLVSMIVNKTKDDITILEMFDLIKNSSISFLTAEKIVRSELMIEAFASQEIPVKDAAEIVAETIDARVHILYDHSEIMKAIEFAQQRIRAGATENVDVDVIGEILRLKEIGEWYKLSNVARAFVGTIWATRTGYNLVITITEPVVPKWRLRETIMKLLSI